MTARSTALAFRIIMTPRRVSYPAHRPARSALTLRLVLASFGLIVFGIAAGITAAHHAPRWWVIVLIAVTVIAASDIAVIIRRKRRGEPG